MATMPNLNPRQHHWLRLYLGRDPELRGNATRCYAKAYGVENEGVAQSGGTRLRRHPILSKLIEKAERDAIATAGIDAQFVLDQSLRLYDIATGDLPTDHEIVDVDEGGRERRTLRQVRQFDPKSAHQALRMIGDNKHVQAFQQNVEVSHTHYLEERLAAKSKVIEGRAQVIDEEPGQLGREHAGQVQSLPADRSQPPAGAEAKKGSIRPEVKSDERAREIDSAPERAGATGK